MSTERLTEAQWNLLVAAVAYYETMLDKPQAQAAFERMWEKLLTRREAGDL